MRTHCKFYESRTYKTGESVQKCDLDLAPEAPWRCPDNCPAYEPRLVDVGWAFGGLNLQKDVPEPPRLDEDAVRLLDEAEDIVNAIAPSTLDEFRKLDQQRSRKWFSKGGGPKFSRGKKKKRK